jgi:hypothetical protein
MPAEDDQLSHDCGGRRPSAFTARGANLVRLEPDARPIILRSATHLSVSHVKVASVPYQFTSIVILDLMIGEVILEPRHATHVEEVCAALAA